MTLLVDIGCPDCGRKTPVLKRDLGRYYCEDCDREFTQADVMTLPDPDSMPDSAGDSDPK